MNPAFVEDQVEELRGQKKLALFCLVLIVVVSIFDLAEDYLEGAPLEHIAFEIALTSISMACILYLWTKSILFMKKQNAGLRSSLSAAQAEAAQWRQDAREMLAGLSKAIDTQFERWGLSEAERDIAGLLLKGLSTKEIAELRNTSEKTVRQQAVAVYEKSNLDGRAQLAAFFLEDLLAPHKR